jgi:ketosteroid isomerase-like protein
MATTSSIERVREFFSTIWQNQDFDAADDFIVEDFVIISGGQKIESREAFKRWARAFAATISDLRIEMLESFQNHDGSRVASLWLVTGRNNGVFGTEPDGAPIEMTLTAVWDVREDGMLLRNRVERNAYEVYRQLTAK